MKDKIAIQIQERIDFLEALLPIAKNKRRLRGYINKLRAAQRLVLKTSAVFNHAKERNA